MVENEEGRTGAVRASDGEREDALRLLAAHFAEGRLDRAEFDERAGAALGARTREQLDALFTDLPTRSSTDAGVARQDDAGYAAPTRPDTAAWPRRAAPMRAGALPLFPLAPMLIALSAVVVLHGLPPFPLVALLAVAAANRRGRRGQRD